MNWIVEGQQYTEAEYTEYQTKKDEERRESEKEVWRLINQLGEAYKACSEFMEEHPEVPYRVMDAQQKEHELYQKLKKNLELADAAPRCEKVRADGTMCGCPQMKGYGYCYAHERMLQMEAIRLELPAQDDGNGVQLAIMRVQKALIDDEISEKKAGLLLYSLQMSGGNLKNTSFGDEHKEMVTEMPENVVIEVPDKPRKARPHHGDAEARRKPSHGEKQNPFTTEDTKEHGGRAKGMKSTPNWDDWDKWRGGVGGELVQVQTGGIPDRMDREDT